MTQERLSSLVAETPTPDRALGTPSDPHLLVSIRSPGVGRLIIHTQEMRNQVKCTQFPACP